MTNGVMVIWKLTLYGGCGERYASWSKDMGYGHPSKSTTVCHR